MHLEEGDLIFLEEGAGDYLNVTCGQKTGKLSARYGKVLWIKDEINAVFSIK